MANVRTAPGGWGVHAEEDVLRWRCRRFSAGALRKRVPEGMIFDRKWSQHGAKREPKWSQNEAMGSQAGTKMEPKRANMLQNGAQEPKDRFSMDFGAILGAIWTPFWLPNGIQHGLRNHKQISLKSPWGHWEANWLTLAVPEGAHSKNRLVAAPCWRLAAGRVAPCQSCKN